MESAEYEAELDAFSNFLKPLKLNRIIETGVRRGASTRRFLRIVGEVLVSIEKDPIKHLDIYDDKWILVKGDSKDTLQDMCLLLNPVDLFYHDSDHSAHHRLWEYRMASFYSTYIASHDVTRDKVWELFLKQYDWKQIFKKGKIAVATRKS